MQTWVVFPRESPEPQVLTAYERLGVGVIDALPARRFDLAIANCQASASAVVDLEDTSPRTPVAFWLHEAWAHRDTALMQRAMARVSAVILQTPYQRDVVYARFLNGRSVPTFLVPYGIAASESLPADPYPRRARYRISTVGAIQPRKRQQDLARALDRLSVDVECLIVGGRRGGGDPLEAFATPNSRLTITGHVENAVARAVIRSSDVVAHPSAAESQPLALLEAMHFGRPIVIANLATYEYQGLRDGVSCLTYPLGDVDALADRISRLLGDEALAARLGSEACRLFDDRFRLDLFEHRLTSTFRAVLDYVRIRKH
jgi:glycosyltransferase involved in cell wall biosynthesis